MIAEIIARLQAQVPALKLVAGAAAFNAASQANPAATPAAFVFTVDETDDENGLEQPMVQEVNVTLAVVLVVRQVSDAQGAAAGIDMETLLKQVSAGLRGWVIGADYDPLARRQSALVAFRDGHMWWQQTWLTRYVAVAVG
jgi:hypothetical protein